MKNSHQSPVTVEVKNLGGIEHVTKTVVPGTNVLAGENATNRTSFLEALATGLGGTQSTVKSDAEEGFVRVEMDGETYERQLERDSTGKDTRINDEGYLKDPTNAELFAWLLSDNEIRQALRTGTNLRDLAMRPVNTEEIERIEANLVADRQEIEEELANLEEKAQQLPELEREIQRLETDTQNLETELKAKRDELAAVDREPDEAREEQSKRNETLEALKNAQGQRESIRERISQQKDAVAAVEDEIEAKEATLNERRNELREFEIDVNRTREDLHELQTRQDELRGLKESLNNIISFNEQRLHEDESELWGLLQTDETSQVEQLTDQLSGDNGSEDLTCWTCGSRVEISTVEAQLDRLRAQQKELTSRLADIEDEVDNLRQQRRQYEDLQDTVKELESAIQELENEAETRRSKIETHKEQLQEIENEINKLETTLDKLEATADDEEDIIALQREINELEFELEKTQRKLKETKSQREQLEMELSRRETLEAEREDIAEELAEVRNEIDRLETAIVEEFNDHMETLIDLLAYDNITRVWIEKKKNGGEDTTFELHIVRQAADGRAYEDTVGNLSESEREIIGITFALAGYIAHEVYEEMPFILFDSVEMIDVTRLARLFEYFQERVDFVIAALLQEDAKELDDQDHNIISFGYPTVAQ